MVLKHLLLYQSAQRAFIPCTHHAYAYRSAVHCQSTELPGAEAGDEEHALGVAGARPRKACEDRKGNSTRAEDDANQGAVEQEMAVLQARVGEGVENVAGEELQQRMRYHQCCHALSVGLLRSELAALDAMHSSWHDPQGLVRALHVEMERHRRESHTVTVRLETCGA